MLQFNTLGTAQLLIKLLLAESSKRANQKLIHHHHGFHSNGWLKVF